MKTQEKIEAFLRQGPFAVVGASANRAKFGNQVLRALLAAGKDPYPIHPSQTQVEGLRCYPNLASLPRPPRSLSIITPPPVTEQIVREAIAVGVQNVWMQPGAESRLAVQEAEQAGLLVIAGGPCLLVTLGED